MTSESLVLIETHMGMTLSADNRLIHRLLYRTIPHILISHSRFTLKYGAECYPYGEAIPPHRPY